jgi:putative phage-type endonuclease
MNDNDLYELLESIEEVYPIEYGFDPYELECIEEELEDYIEFLIEEAIFTPEYSRELLIQTMRHLKMTLQYVEASSITINQERLEKTFERLYSFQGISQRSEQWFQVRHNILSASTCKNVLAVNLEEKKGMRFIHDRLRDAQVFSGSFNIDKPDAPMVRGTRYEPILRDLYEKLNDCKVEEFDCVIHRDIPFIGASPDGIIVSGNHCGRMLEIKCPMPDSAIKDGEVVRIEYWYQMQVQMEVCELEECDYFRVVVRDFPTIMEMKVFLMDIPEEEIVLFGTVWSHPETGKHGKGSYGKWISQFSHSYLERQIGKNLSPQDIQSIIYRHYVILKKDIFQWLVRRNRDWFYDVYLPQAEEVWEEILRGREDPDAWDTANGFAIPLNETETQSYYNPRDTLTPKGVCLID